MTIGQHRTLEKVGLALANLKAIQVQIEVLQTACEHRLETGSVDPQDEACGRLALLVGQALLLKTDTKEMPRVLQEQAEKAVFGDLT